MSTIPQIDPTYINPLPRVYDRLSRIHELKRSDPSTNVLLAGPTGCGKTTFAEQYAAHHKRPLFVLECGAISEGEQLIGQWEVRQNAEGTSSYTVFQPSGFIEAVQTPKTVIVLNELNRFQSIKAENMILSLLDHQRMLFVPEMHKTIRVADGVQFFATINEGAEYTATDIMDYALKNRFSRRHTLDYIGERDEIKVLTARTGIDESTAKDLVRLARNLRGTSPVSMRQLEACAEEILLGAEISEALACTFTSVVELDELNTMAAATIQGLRAWDPSKNSALNKTA